MAIKRKAMPPMKTSGSKRVQTADKDSQAVSLKTKVDIVYVVGDSALYPTGIPSSAPDGWPKFSACLDDGERRGELFNV